VYFITTGSSVAVENIQRTAASVRLSAGRRNDSVGWNGACSADHGEIIKLPPKSQNLKYELFHITRRHLGVLVHRMECMIITHSHTHLLSAKMRIDFQVKKAGSETKPPNPRFMKNGPAESLFTLRHPKKHPSEYIKSPTAKRKRTVSSYK